jgi:hypothetical protein
MELKYRRIPERGWGITGRSRRVAFTNYAVYLDDRHIATIQGFVGDGGTVGRSLRAEADTPQLFKERLAEDRTHGTLAEAKARLQRAADLAFPAALSPHPAEKAGDSR